MSTITAVFFGGLCCLTPAPVEADLPTSGLVLQLDASTLTGLTEGAEVTSWAATVGGTSFTNFSDSSKPQYYPTVASLGNKPALYFDADCMTSSSTFGITGANDRTVIAVWADAVNTGANYQHVLHMGTDAANQAYGLSVNRAGNTGTVGNHYWGGGFDSTIKASTAGNMASLSFSGGIDTVYVNGWYAGQSGSLTLNTASNTTLIGSRLAPGTNSSEGIKGYVAEVLVYNKVLSSTEMLQVNQYVANKYGLSIFSTDPPRTIDTTGAQINLDFTTKSITGGTYTGIQNESGNDYLRIIDSAVGGSNNYAYLTDTNTASGSISGSFDMRFTNANADGASFILAGSGVNVADNYGTKPAGETPTFANSFGIGYSIYNKNQVNLYWDNQLLGTIDTNYKTGNWFTTDFQIDYGPGGYGADVYVQLYDKASNGLMATFTTAVPWMNAGANQLLLRGRTGGATSSADFDNIRVLYKNSTVSEFIWTPNASGDFTDASKWQGGVAPTAGSFAKINSGTNRITSPVVVQDGITLEVTSATIMPSLTVKDGSIVAINTSTTVNSDTSVGTTDNYFVIGQSTNSTENKVVVEEGGILNVGVGNGIRIAHTAGSYGELVVNGTAIVTGSYLLGAFLGESHITVSGANATLTAKNTILGDNNGANTTSFLTIENGGTVKLDRLSIADKSNAVGTVAINNGKLNVVGELRVGNIGVGTMTVENGTVTTGKLLVAAENRDKNSNMTVSGSTITSDGDFLVGDNGNGFLTVDSDSTVTAGTVYIGYQSWASGTINITDSNFTSHGSMLVGRTGKGYLTLDGDTVMNTNGDFMLAHESASASGSEFTIGGNAVLNVNGHLIFGRSGAATTTIQDNAVINFIATESRVCGIGELYTGDGVVVNMAGGTFNVNKNPGSYNGMTLHNKGLWNQTGGVVNIGTADLTTNLLLKNSSTYSLSGGVLNITGNLSKEADASFAFNDGVLAANTIDFDLTQVGGVLSPGIDWNGTGMALGTTTVNGNYTQTGGTILMELDLVNGLSDVLKVSGEMSFGENAKVELVYDQSLIGKGMSFDLFQDTEGNQITGWENLAKNMSSLDDYYWNINTSTPGVLTFEIDGAVVPEPSTWVMLILGVFGLLGIGSRRRK